MNVIEVLWTARGPLGQGYYSRQRVENDFEKNNRPAAQTFPRPFPPAKLSRFAVV